MTMAFLRKRSKAVVKAEDAMDQAPDLAIAAATPSPNPATNLLIADVALRGGGALLKRAVEAGLLGATATSKRKAKDVVKGRSLEQMSPAINRFLSEQRHDAARNDLVAANAPSLALRRRT